jgi:hypothetical protein
VLPLVKVLASLAAATIIAGLTALSAVLASVLGFVERHRVAMAALATVITLAVIPSITAAVAGFARMTAALAGQAVLNGVLGMSKLAGAIQAVGAAGLVAGAAVTFGIGLAIYELTSSLAENQRRAQAAAQAVQAIGKSFDALRPGSLKDVTQGLDDYANAAIKVALAKGTIDSIEQAGAAAKAAAAEQKLLNDQQHNTDINLQKIAKSLGVTTDAVRTYAAHNNVDLTKPWDQSSEAIDQVKSGLQALATQAGVSLPQLSTLAGSDVDAMQALADAIKKATDATAQAFSSSFDIVGQFKPEQGAQAVADAQKKLSDSQHSLTDEEARFGAQRKHTVASSQQLANAHTAVADAAKNLSKAQADAAKTGDLTTIYQNDITAARRFVTEINDATQRDLDPQLISRLLQDGPEKAGPLLDALVQGHSNRLIRLANQSEKTLAQISARAVEMARLTALAINAPSDALGRDLPRAMRIAQTLAAQGSKATAASLLRSLHLPASEITRIAQEFGITLPRAIQTQLDTHPVHVSVTAKGGALSVNGKVVGTAAASGGYIHGPGSGTSDSVPAWLSNGEFVQRAAAVDFYGVDFMRRLNLMQVPRFADGGAVGVSYAASRAAAAGGTRIIVQQPVIVQPHVKHETNLNGVQFGDADAYERFEARQRRSRAVWS